MYTVFLHTMWRIPLCFSTKKMIRQSSFHRIPLIIFTDTSSLKYLWIAEGFGKQIRFPNIIRRRNSLPPRKTVGFKAFAAEPICLFLCYNKLKTCFQLNFPAAERQQTNTFCAPARYNSFAHSLQVVPVVKISSTKSTCFPIRSSVTAKAFFRFCRRCLEESSVLCAAAFPLSHQNIPPKRKPCPRRKLFAEDVGLVEAALLFLLRVQGNGKHKIRLCQDCFMVFFHVIRQQLP